MHPPHPTTPTPRQGSGIPGPLSDCQSQHLGTSGACLSFGPPSGKMGIKASLCHGPRRLGGAGRYSEPRGRTGIRGFCGCQEGSSALHEPGGFNSPRREWEGPSPSPCVGEVVQHSGHPRGSGSRALFRNHHPDVTVVRAASAECHSVSPAGTPPPPCIAISCPILT